MQVYWLLCHPEALIYMKIMRVQLLCLMSPVKKPGFIHVTTQKRDIVFLQLLDVFISKHLLKIPQHM